MRLELGHKGDWYVDPRDLAVRLGVSAENLKRLERYGYVDARIREGSGEEAGRTRVTVRLLSSGWRGTFDRTGALISEEKW